MRDDTLRWPWGRLAASLAAALLLAGGFLLQADAARLTSAVVDEPAHLTAGYLSLARGEHRVNVEHPPLLKLLAALPLTGLDPRLPPIDPGGPEPGTEDFEFDYSRRFLYGSNDPDRLLASARLPMIFLTALLGAFVYVWTREIAGTAAALAALLLYVLEPNILGHGRLVTTDLGASVFIVATLWSFRHAVRRGSATATIACGLFLGCALLSKFSALLLLPVMALLLGMELILRRRESCGSAGRVTPGRMLLLAGLAVGLAWVILLAGYGFDGFPVPGLYTEGMELARLKNSTVEGPTYLMGSISRDGFWSYYLVALAVKTPIPLLLLSLAGIVSGLREQALRREIAWLLLPALAWIAAITLLTRAQIGFRYILPALPLLCVSAGVGAAFLMRGFRLESGEKGARPRLRAAAGALLAILLLWHGLAAVRIHPHHLAYFNEIAGGPGNGWRWLADSNLDWGQDLIRLDRWLESRGNPPVNLFYFGTADPDYYGIPRLPYGSPSPGLFAVSATHLAGVYLPDPDYLEAFRSLEPIARIGHSILVYDLESVPPRLRRPLRRPSPSRGRPGLPGPRQP